MTQPQTNSVSHSRPSSLAGVKVVSRQEAHTYPGGEDVFETAHKLGLELYRGPAKRYWVGSPDPSWPDHDRWFYSVLRADIEKDESWAGAPVMTYYSCRDEPGYAGGSLELELENQWRRVNRLREVSTIGLDTTEFTHRYLLLYQVFGYLNEDQTLDAMRAPWGRDLHDLLQHYDAWSAAHEAQDFPQDLMLRMHGLGAYVDARNDGWDWLA